jgi:hypothetical protein
VALGSAIALDVFRTVDDRDWRADGIFWCVTLLAVGACSLLWLFGRRRDRSRAAKEGLLYDGFAQISVEPLSPPASVKEAFAHLRKSVVFGRTKLDHFLFNGRLMVKESEISWEPGRIARDRGATGWTVNPGDVDYAEIGRVTGHWMADLRFRNGGQVHMVIRDSEALADALRMTRPSAGAAR